MKTDFELSFAYRTFLISPIFSYSSFSHSENFPPLFNKSTTHAGIERRISHHNFYFNETKGFYCLRTEMGDSKCLRETKGRRHPDVDPKVISKLRKFFAEHNQKFYELVGEDLGWPEE